MKEIIGENYTKLDDNVSFQLVRTNPVLTSNVKLMYDGSNMFLESFDANNKINSSNYKKYRVFYNNLYNDDLSEYWRNISDDSVYEISNNTDIYESKIELLSENYDKKFGYLEPLYIK